MKKIILSRVLACILIIVAVFATACDRSEEVNIAGSITDLYLAGSLSREDIKNIAALRVGAVYEVDSEEQEVEDYRRLEYEPIVPEPLTEEQKKRIEEAVAADAMELYGMAVYNYKFQEYYGEYNGFHIVEVYYDLEGGNWLTEVRRMITAGIYLGLRGYPPLYVWQDV